MFPDQQLPQPSPQPSYPPAQPQYGYNSAPQQAPGGAYQVVPPLPPSNNTGHSGHNPYEFIVNPDTAKHHRGGLFGGSALAIRVALFGGGIAVLMIIIAVVMSALGPKSIAPSLVAITQRQQEIVHVADAAGRLASSDNTKNFVTNVSINIGSSQQQVFAYLTTHGTKKLSPKVLALDKSAATDTLLSNAATAGNYDPTVVQNLTGQLQSYEQQLQTAFKQTKGKNAQALLQNCFKSADLLLQQAKATTTQ